MASDAKKCRDEMARIFERYGASAAVNACASCYEGVTFDMKGLQQFPRHLEASRNLQLAATHARRAVGITTKEPV